MFKRLVSLCLAVGVMLTSCLIGELAITASAEGLNGENGLTTYVFTGDYADIDGYAEGTVTLSGGSQSYYVLYWANDEGVLEGYYPIASVSKSVAEYSFKRNVGIPSGATKLAVFSDADGKVTDTSLSNAIDIVEIPVSKQMATEEYFSFASISDVHVNDTYYGGPEKCTAALNWFTELGLEKIILSGDVSSQASTEEMTSYVNAVNASTYDIMDIYESRGNHEAPNNENFLYYTSGGVGDWVADDEVRPFADSPYYYKLFEAPEGEFDNLFIFMALEVTATGNVGVEDPFSEKQIDWVESVLEEYAGTDTNIYIVEHAPFFNWGPGDRVNGSYGQWMRIKNKFPQVIRFKGLLTKYKEVIMMSGHTHVEFEEDVNFNDENGTAARMIHNSSLGVVKAYSGTSLNQANAGTTASYGSQAYAVKVYSDYIVYNAANVSEKMFYPEFCYILESYSEDRSKAVDIEITKLPDSNRYEIGSWIVPSGLEVTAEYADGTKEVVRGWELSLNGVTTVRDTELSVIYNGIQKPIAVELYNPFYTFEGDGTYENPYLIEDAEDFYNFTENMKMRTSSDSSNQDEVYGYELFFKQTNDIDMTGYAGYKGINAGSSQKYGFSGVYDGGGNSIKVDIERMNDGDIAIFPYVNGVIMNLTFEGRIKGSTAQPMRTIGSYGLVINCKSELTLEGGTGRGLTQTMYGTACRYYYNGEITASTKKPTIGTHEGGKYLSVYYNCGDITADYGKQMWDNDVILEEFNSANDSNVISAVGIMKGFSPELSEKSLFSWKTDGDDVALDKDNTLSQGSTENIAPYGEAFDDGRTGYYNIGATAESLNDGDLSTGWQYKDYNAAASFAGIKFDNSYLIDSVTLFWEDGNAASEYKVQYSEDGENWNDIKVIKMTSEEDVDTFYFEEVNAKAIRAYMTKYPSTKYAPKLYEITVFKSYNREKPSYDNGKITEKDGYILGFNAGVTLEEYKAMTENAKAVLNAEGGAIKAGGAVSTGAIVKLDGLEYVIIVSGDVNGDGKVNSTDFMQIRKQYLGLFELSEAQGLSADVSGDGKINSTDFMQVRRHFLGLFDLYA